MPIEPSGPCQLKRRRSTQWGRCVDRGVPFVRARCICLEQNARHVWFDYGDVVFRSPRVVAKNASGLESALSRATRRGERAAGRNRV